MERKERGPAGKIEKSTGYTLASLSNKVLAAEYRIVLPEEIHIYLMAKRIWSILQPDAVLANHN